MFKSWRVTEWGTAAVDESTPVPAYPPSTRDPLVITHMSLDLLLANPRRFRRGRVQRARSLGPCPSPGCPACVAAREARR